MNKKLDNEEIIKYTSDSEGKNVWIKMCGNSIVEASHGEVNLEKNTITINTTEYIVEVDNDDSIAVWSLDENGNPETSGIPFIFTRDFFNDLSKITNSKEQETDYNLFLKFNAVVNVPNEKEFKRFLKFAKEKKLDYVDYLEKIYHKYGFEEAFAYNGGIRRFENKAICFEYMPGKGFTTGSKKEYLDYDSSIKILKVDDLIKDKSKNRRKDLNIGL